MYELAVAGRHDFRRPGAADVYVLDVRRAAAGLAAVTSDGRLALLDAARLGDAAAETASWPTAHEGVTALGVLGGALVCTAGEDGSVAVWDARLGATASAARVAHFRASDGAPVLSLACSPAAQTLAVGTALRDHTASILLWDVRAAAPGPRARYDEVHSDDVTTLAFDAAAPARLLSGSTDGLVNLYDTRVADEDDVTQRTLNHGASLHRAGFLAAADAVFALSHDERFAVYPVDSDADTDADAAPARGCDLGDLRPLLGCQYVADVVASADGRGAIVGAGSHDAQAFGLVFLAHTWTLDTAGRVALRGAHGGDVVRAFCLVDEQQTVVTAGEDGCVRAWRPEG